jgi:uncharacterized membrane protein YeaQ/YmgE (transglycosylase-associated protein family)
VLIFAIICFGLIVGAAAQWLLYRSERSRINWGLALVAGLVGSLIGGLLGSLLFGDGLDVRPSGVIGSLVGALIVTAIWTKVRPATPAARPRPAGHRR